MRADDAKPLFFNTGDRARALIVEGTPGKVVRAASHGLGVEQKPASISWRHQLMTDSLPRVGPREFRVQLLPDVPPGRYAAIVQAVVGVLAAADVLSEAAITVDDLARDEDLNDAFDQFSALYPWSQC